MDHPPLTLLSARASEIVAEARALLEEAGRDGLTMRALAGRLGIQAPSLYKHFPDKAAVESAIIELGFLELGLALHAALGGPEPVTALFAAYRERGLANPHLYRLATEGALHRSRLAPGLEDWAGWPFGIVAGDPWAGQAMWAFAHGMVILEIDGRFSDSSHLDSTWQRGAKAFTPCN